MPDTNDVDRWTKMIRRRYENYLKTAFFFKESRLRKSLQSALEREDSLLKGPFPEPARGFKTGLERTGVSTRVFSSRQRKDSFRH